MQQERFSTIHDHCAICYDRECLRKPDYSTSCELIQCDEGCEAILHACKLTSHLPICPYVIVPCINKDKGCPENFRRFNMVSHLLNCPSSVVNYWAFEDAGDGNKVVRRGEYSWHVQNIRNDIPNGIGSKCPLSDMGCNFTCLKRSPLFPRGHLTFSTLLNSIGLVLDDIALSNPTICDSSTATSDEYHQNTKTVVEQADAFFSLDDFPEIILEKVVLYLDSFSINNLSLTSKFLRSICQSMLIKKGMVEPVRKKNENGEGAQRWTYDKWKWSFSSACEPIRQWQYHLSTPIAEHLKVCHYYPERIRNCNKTIECDNGCGYSFPEYNYPEHKKRCQLEMVPCINKEGGCNAVVMRSKISSHLRHCPANVVKCYASRLRQEMGGLCGGVFRREEIINHQQFIHVDVCEETVLECPLSSYGCSFSIAKRTPLKPPAELRFDSDAKSFNIVQQQQQSTFAAGDITAEVQTNLLTDSQQTAMETCDCHFENTPRPLILIIISFLDSLSISKMVGPVCKYLLP